MLLYRTFFYDPSSRADEAGHPDYLHRPQGKGRLDNPSNYDTWYFSCSPEGAVGEVFADITVWGEDMFDVPAMPSCRRALGTWEIDDDLPLLYLDDARALVERSLRPTQVIARNRPMTQAWAQSIFNEKGNTGERRWSGVKWWSYHRPTWTVVALWYAPGEPLHQQFVDVTDLSVTHVAIQDAAKSLGKTFV